MTGTNPPVYSGYVWVVLTGGIAWALSPVLVFLNPVILALLLGILAGNLFRPGKQAAAGIGFFAGRGLEFAIVLLAFGIDYRRLSGIGWQTLVFLVVAMGLFLFIIPRLSKRFRCPGDSGILIGFGTAICGSSAIAALSPRLKSSAEDTGIAMAVVNLLGTLLMLALPPLFRYFGLEDHSVAYFLGSSLHAVGNVAGAAYPFGEEVLSEALSMKLARVALLTPALFFVAFLLNRRKNGDGSGRLSIPWYLWAFLGITVLNSLITLPAPLLGGLKVSGEIVLTLAMAGIGWKLRLGSLIRSGKKGLLFGVMAYLLYSMLLLIPMLVFR